LANSVTNGQMFFILVLTVSSYTTIDIPKIVAQTAGRSGWMLILAFALVFGLAASMIVWLNNHFQGKVLFDYGQEIIGMVGSRVIVIYYLLMFILVGAYLKIRLVNFLSSNFLPKTPQAAMLAICVALFGFVSYHGVTNVARLFVLFGTLFLITTIALVTVMLSQGMSFNMESFVNPDEIKEFPSALIHFVFLFRGISVLFIIPFTQANRRAELASFGTLAFIGVLYIMIVEGTISILGINNTILYSDSFIEATKVTNIPIIERTDIFYLTVGLMSLFAGMIIVFLGTLEFACRLFPQISRLIMTIITSVILYALSVLALGINNVTEVMDKIAPYLTLVGSVIIPAILVALTKIRKLGGSTEGGT